mmetsp:Transcript_24417/g.81941  ORF Transcript_24417/g.81941 Transcript_24417/m.81941 type:complete len:219 (-) Transcript_24417:661-1317(-)
MCSFSRMLVSGTTGTRGSSSSCSRNTWSQRSTLGATTAEHRRPHHEPGTHRRGPARPAHTLMLFKVAVARSRAAGMIATERRRAALRQKDPFCQWRDVGEDRLTSCLRLSASASLAVKSPMAAEVSEATLLSGLGAQHMAGGRAGWVHGLMGRAGPAAVRSGRPLEVSGGIRARKVLLFGTRTNSRAQAWFKDHQHHASRCGRRSQQLAVSPPSLQSL